VVVVDHGRVIADGTPQGLKSELVGDRLAVTAIDEADASRVAAAIRRLGRPQAVEVDGAAVTGRVRDAASLLPELLRVLDTGDVPVAAAEVARATLDDVFLALTGRSLRESAVAAEPPPAAEPAGAVTATTPVLEEQAS
jgi:ABC-2 type transport system ATP-binding protein